MTKKRKGLDILGTIQSSGNVKAACQALGISRSQYYKLRQQPAAALPKSYTPNKMGVDTAKRIIELATLRPLGCHSISAQLEEEGAKVSAVSIQKLLKRFQLGTSRERLVALQQQLLEDQDYILHPEQQEFLARHNPALLELGRKIGAPGALLSFFSCFLGQMPLLGKVYAYFALDAYSGYIQGMAVYGPDKYLSSRFLKNEVLPFYRNQTIQVVQIETSSDPDFFSYTTHPFSSYIRNLGTIKHQRTTIGGTTTNGFCQRFGMYLQQHILPTLKLKKAWYQDLEQLDRDLHDRLDQYNQAELRVAADHFALYPTLNQSPRAILEAYLKESAEPK